MSARADVLGVLIDKVTLPEAEEQIEQFVQSGKAHQIVTVNLDFISQSMRNPKFLDLINTSSLSVADGMGVMWAAKLLDESIPARVTGTTLVRSCCRLARDKGDGVFLLGAAPGVAHEAGEVLCNDYPGLHVAGTYSPPYGAFSQAENQKIVDMINASGAKYLFVAFGAPKQDFWIRQHLAELGVSVSIGIGGVFNYLTGRVKPAPSWVQNIGAEWLFRTVQEPNRLAKRYFVDDLPILFNVLGHRFSLPKETSPSLASTDFSLSVPQPVRSNLIALDQPRITIR